MNMLDRLQLRSALCDADPGGGLGLIYELLTKIEDRHISGDPPECHAEQVAKAFDALGHYFFKLLPEKLSPPPTPALSTLPNDRNALAVLEAFRASIIDSMRIFEETEDMTPLLLECGHTSLRWSFDYSGLPVCEPCAALNPFTDRFPELSFTQCECVNWPRAEAIIPKGPLGHNHDCRKFQDLAEKACEVSGSDQCLGSESSRCLPCSARDFFTSEQAWRTETPNA